MAAALKKFRLLEKQTDEVQQPAAPASKTQVIKLLFFSVFIFNLESDYFSYINEKYFKITLNNFCIILICVSGTNNELDLISNQI